MKSSVRLFFLVALITLLSALGMGLPAPQQRVEDSAEAKARLAQFQKHQALRASSPFKDVKWIQVGPMRPSGRMTDVEVHPAQPNVVYAAAAQGGVWKSTDDGDNWSPIFDDYPAGAIGDLAIAPSNPRIVWVGTGEANIFRSSQSGIGIFKSTDAGAHFTYMGLGDTHNIARIIMHPTNPDIVYVASPGHEYTYNPDRGIFKTSDGGKTWHKIFYKDEKTGVIDLAMDPSNSDIMYASTAERLRYRWNDPKPTPQSGLYKTTDAGKTWSPLANGLPDFSQGDTERIGIDICRTRPDVVYALVDRIIDGNDGAYLYRSNDKGASWQLVEGNDSIKRIYPGYGWVFGQVRVDPSNPDTVYVMGLNYQRSTDGGKTWAPPPARGHSDYHGMWINPNDTNHILVVNDGGIMISHDGLATAKHPVNLPIGHMFTVAVSQTKGKFYAYSNIQDTGGWRGEIDMTAGRDKIPYQEWESAIGDEAGRHAVNPVNPDIVYFVTRYGGGPTMMDYKAAQEAAAELAKAQAQAQAQGGAQAQQGRGQAQAQGRGGAAGQAQGRGGAAGQGQARGQAAGGRRGRPGQTQIAPDFGGEAKRAQWVSPIIVSPHDPNRVLYGAQFVFLTDDQGKTWKKISPDLTNFDPAKQGNIAYSTVWSIAESPLKKGLIYAGTDDGNLHVTRDEGGAWEKINQGLPPERFMASIEASRFDEGTVYVVVNGKRHDDFNTYLFKSTDYGKNWTNIATSVPGGIANVVKEDPANKNILYLGTDQGVYVTVDGGKKWEVLGGNLPTCHVFDMVVQEPENVLVIGTHGRSCWVADLLPVRAARPLESAAHLPGRAAAK